MSSLKWQPLSLASGHPQSSRAFISECWSHKLHCGKQFSCQLSKFGRCSILHLLQRLTVKALRSAEKTPILLCLVQYRLPFFHFTISWINSPSAYIPKNTLRYMLSNTELDHLPFRISSKPLINCCRINFSTTPFWRVIPFSKAAWGDSCPEN